MIRAITLLKKNLSTLFLIFRLIFLIFEDLVGEIEVLSSSLTSATLPLKNRKKNFTSINFVENQLSSSLISLSPLIKNHPYLLPQTRVQSSKFLFETFQLVFD